MPVHFLQPVTVARPLVPRQGETLAQFLDRVMEERGRSLNNVARDLAGRDGKDEKTWQRTLRRWTSGSTAGTIDPANATTVGLELRADLSGYVSNPETVRDILTQVVERLDSLEQRVAALGG